jgi:hypothetical protein
VWCVPAWLAASVEGKTGSMAAARMAAGMTDAFRTSRIIPDVLNRRQVEKQPNQVLMLIQHIGPEFGNPNYRAPGAA